jgi:hypothetical protein
MKVSLSLKNEWNYFIKKVEEKLIGGYYHSILIIVKL